MSKIVFITDEGSNVSHLGGNKHHKCIAHILATISRHITQPYAAEKANDDVIAVESAIDDLHVFVSDLRRVTAIRQALRGVLLLPVATRWLSILAILAKRLLEMLQNNIFLDAYVHTWKMFHQAWLLLEMTQ